MEDPTEMFLDDEMTIDPLFEEDWLHESNLDILFDLFEEEIESKIGVDPSSGSSALFGTSPVTSYLFGTSPTLASALDLIYFDNQQHHHQQQQHQSVSSNNGSNNVSTTTNFNVSITTSTTTSTATASATASSNLSTSTAQTIANIINSATAPINQANTNRTICTYNIVNGTKVSSRSASNGAQQVIQANNNPLNSAKNATKIKRGLKKGHSEGTSLLAKPVLSNNDSKANGNGKLSSDISSSCSNKSNNKMNINTKKIGGLLSKNTSHKTSVKITNFKNSIIIGNATNPVINRNGIDINYSRQSQQQNRERYYLSKCQQHVHYITGRAVIREHAYAVRGH